MEKKEEIIQPLSENEMENAAGGFVGCIYKAWICDITQDDVICSNCGSRYNSYIYKKCPRCNPK